MTDSLDLLDGLDFDIPSASEQGGSASDSSAAAEFLGPYQLIRQVGHGGVAKVFLARHIHPGYADHTFAIKVLHDEVSRDSNVVELFRHEAYVLSLLKHPNIVRTFEAGNQDNKLFIAMEFMDGCDLDNMLTRCRKLQIKIPTTIAMHLIGESIKALVYAHELRDPDGVSLNLVHRDVNPANVFLSYDGRVKLGDFGVASIAAGLLKKERQLAGKAGYFAPEQLAGDEVDHRADLFAMGVMMFEVLCGVPLFEATTTDKLIRLNKKAKIPKPSKINPNIPPELEAVMLHALRRKPSERFANGNEMLSALEPFIPATNGMPLAIAALIRQAFLQEHIQAIQLKEGLESGRIDRGSGQMVYLCTPDKRAQTAFSELLRARDFRCEAFDTIDLLATASKPTPPSLILLDVSCENFRLEHVSTIIARIDPQPALVAFSEALEPKWVRLADVLGASDLLFKPFNVERALTAVRSAILGLCSVARDEAIAEVQTLQQQPKLLLISRNPASLGTLQEELVARGYKVEVSPSVQHALLRTGQSSPHCVVFDCFPASATDRRFVPLLRSQPGMGLVPVLFIIAQKDQGALAGFVADRTAVRLREDPVEVLLQTLTRLRGDTALGRTFLRYRSSFSVEMRYGGRVFSGHTVDISRGGIMIQCQEQMPPLGTEVSVNMRLPTATVPLEAHGRVARVSLDESNVSQVGVEFEHFRSTGEGLFIAYLATLSAEPPPEPENKSKAEDKAPMRAPFFPSF